MRIHVWSSNGEFIIDEDGKILDEMRYVGGELPHIWSFDTKEYISTYGKLDENIDILDIGFHYEPTDGGTKYMCAEPDFRQHVRDYDAMNNDGSVEKDGIHWNVMR